MTIEQLDLFDSPFDEANRNYKLALEAYDKAYESLQIAKKLRNELCPHTEVESKSTYYDGSYYDKAYTNHWIECKCCGKKSEITTETHSWYG
jgi:hypothetical protein